jgi:hypothetical protein
MLEVSESQLLSKFRVTNDESSINAGETISNVFRQLDLNTCQKVV